MEKSQELSLSLLASFWPESLFKKKSLFLARAQGACPVSCALALALALLLAPGPVLASNTGGVAHKPEAGDYSGTLDGTNPSPSDGNVSIDSNVSGNVHGGYSDTGAVSNNTVGFSAGQVDGNVYGGLTSSGAGQALNNSVNISGNATANDEVYGGKALGGNAEGNTVTLTGNGYVENRIFGGHTESGNATNNSVTVSGGDAQYDVIGAYAENGNAVGNSITVSGGNIEYEARGGYSGNGDAVGNRVIVSGGHIDSSVTGGYAENGNATGNSVTVTGGKPAAYSGERIFGGYVGGGNGNATNNSVIISGGTVTSKIYGGYIDAGTGSAIGNRVEVSTINTGQDVFGAQIFSDGEACNNTLVLTDATVANAYGAQVSSSNDVPNVALGNSLTLAGSTQADEAYGGYSWFGPATNNSATIKDNATTTDSFWAGYSVEGNAEGNQAQVQGGTVTKSAIGGYAYEGGSALNNSLHMTGGEVKENVIGGYVEKGAGSASGNIVWLEGGTVKKSVVGGGVGLGTGNSSNNRVIASGGTVLDTVRGGDALDGDALNNYAEFSGTASTKLLQGGYSESGNAGGNEVLMLGGSVSGGVRGGTVKTGDGVAFGNSVRISGGSASAVVSGFSTNGNAEGNSVIISGGTISGAVRGGESNDKDVQNNYAELSGTGSVNFLQGGYIDSANGKGMNNEVLMLGGTVNNSIQGVYVNGNGVASGNTVRMLGGTAQYMLGGYSAGGNAVGNSAVMQGGTVSENLLGGESGSGRADNNTAELSGGSVNYITGGYSKTGASGNVVRVSGGTVGGNMTGGVAWDSGDATNNSVYISGSPVLNANTEIWGGEAQNGTSSGNALHFSSMGLSAKNVSHFQEYHFYLPASFTSGDAMLTLNDLGGTDISNTSVSMNRGMSGGGTALAPGMRLSLIKNSSGLNTTGVNLKNNMQVQQGISLQHTLAMNISPTSIDAVVTSTSVDPKTESITQGQTAGTASLNLGADLVAGSGMSNALTATGAAPGASELQNGLSGGDAVDNGIAPFAALSGGFMHYNSGAGADVNGLALMAGLAKRFEASSADFLLGAFFDAGWGTARSYTNTDSGRMTGKTNSNYAGGGLLGRVDLSSTMLKGLYAETSLRIGYLNQEYRNSDLRAIDGRAASYDLGSTYYGIHAGLGYIWNFGQRANLDMYAKYFWNHQKGGDVNIAGDPYSFGNSNSQRTRVGGRINFAVNERFSTYAGAAWEHEFDGKFRATTYGLDVPTSTVQGDTGVGELGIRFRPFGSGAATGFSVDLNVQGLLGKREGVMGNLQLVWEF